MERPSSLIARARHEFHSALLQSVLTIDAKGVPTNADKDNSLSVSIGVRILDRIGGAKNQGRVAGQTSGNRFETLCRDFLLGTFLSLSNLRPGDWRVEQVVGRNRLAIADYDQYSHLVDLKAAADANPALAAALGNDYTITPDVVIVREPEPDETINNTGVIVDESCALLTSLRKSSGGKAILHASISCKWTMRSDRAQNARTEALNLIRNRKGHLPHIVVITAEPTPARIASIALGTGDIDCVYHFALPELVASIADLKKDDAEELLGIMVDGRRLKDISDLPLDLAV